MKKLRLYYTNATADRHKAREIQLKIEAETGLELVNPFYNCNGDPTEEIKQLDSGVQPTVSWSEIVATDKKMIRECDGIVAFISSKSSFGSAMEIFYCHDTLGKPVYSICLDSNTRQHPWLLEFSNKMFGTIEGFVQFAKEKLVSQ